MDKWNEVCGTCNPEPIYRKEYSFLWPDLEFCIEVNNSYSDTFCCCCWKSNDLWVNNWLAWYCRYWGQLGWMIFSESNVKMFISSNSYPLREFSIAILWKCFHQIWRSSPKYFSLDLTIKINKFLASAVQW